MAPELVFTAAIANREFRNAAAQFAHLGEVTAKQASSIEHQDWCGIGRTRRAAWNHFS
jgi:hypothetical protein